MNRVGRNSARALAPAFLVILLLAAFFTVQPGADPYIIWPCLIIFYSYGVSALRRPFYAIKGIKSYFSLEVLFLTFCFLIYFQPYQMYALGIFNLYNQTSFRDAFFDFSNQAVIYSTLGVVAFCAGLGRQPAPPTNDANETPLILRQNRQLRHLNVISFCGSGALLTIYDLAGWRSAGEGRYTTGASGGAAAEGTALLITMFCMISIAFWIATKVRRERTQFVTLMGLAVAAYWAVRLLSVGDRNTFLLLAIVAAGGYASYVRRVGLPIIVLAIVGGLAGYNAIEAIRLSGSISIESLIQYFMEPAPETDSVSSFNNTTVTARAALYAVPNLYDFGLGIFKFIGFAGIIPLVRGIVLPNYTGPTTTSEILTNIMLGPNSSWGVGTNVISDLYMDFGIFGVPVGMYLLGRFARGVRRAAVQHPTSTRATVFYLLMLALFAETPRYAIDFPVRVLVWTALVVWGLRMLQGNARQAHRITT